MVRVATQPTFTVERPTVLFEEPCATDPVFGGTPNYDVSLDGQRFLMVESTGAGESATVTLVLNWSEELERLVPTPLTPVPRPCPTARHSLWVPIPSPPKIGKGGMGRGRSRN